MRKSFSKTLLWGVVTQFCVGRSFNLKHTISNHLLYLNIYTKTENNMMIIYSKILNNRKRKKNTSWISEVFYFTSFLKKLVTCCNSGLPTYITNTCASLQRKSTFTPLIITYVQHSILPLNNQQVTNKLVTISSWIN